MKKLNYNGVQFEYNHFISEFLFSDYYEVVLFNNDKQIATLTLSENQISSL